MKKILIGLVLVVFIVGCGKKESTQKIDYLKEGMKYLSQQDLGNAVKSFDLAIQKDPQNVDVYLSVSTIYLKLKNYAAVDALCAKALKLDPTSGDAYYFLAMSQGAQGRVAEATELAKKSFSLFAAQNNQQKAAVVAILLKKIAVSQTPSDSNAE